MMPFFKNVKRGWRTISGKRIYFDSKSEANYYRILLFLKTNKDIKNFEYHPPVFDFTQWIKFGTLRYELDFKVTENDGRIYYVEIKSTDNLDKMDSSSRTRIKRFKKYYPNCVLRIVTSSSVRNIGNKLPLVGWER